MGTSIRPIGGNSRNVARTDTGTATGAAASPAGGRKPNPAFDNLTRQEAQAALTHDLPDYLEASRKFVEGDHWQNGDGWIGPLPQSSSEAYDTTVALIKKGFVSKNVIAEIVERHMTGVVGREPSWTLVPRRADLKDTPITDAERNAAAEPTQALVEWWEARQIHQIAQAAVARLLWATRSPGRIYVPPAEMTNVEGKTGEVSARTLRGALSKLYVEALEHDVATVATEPDSRQEIGILAVKPGGDPFGRNTGTGEARVFVSYLEGRDPAADPGAPGYVPPRTVIREIADRKGGGTQSTGTASAGTTAEGVLPLGGRLTIHEMRRRPLITLQIHQAQRAINLAASLSPRTIVSAGFLSRILTNVVLRGKKERIGGEDVFIPEPPQFGAGITTVLEGLEVEGNGRQGGASKMTPGVHTIPAQPVTPLIEAKRAHYEDALEESDQVHVLINGEATPSGKSREEARADYVMSLLMTSAPAIAFVRWILETALAYAEAIIGTPGKWTNDYRVEVRLRMSTGKPSTAEREANRADVKANLLSRESALEANDVADPDAEITRMDGDPISEYAEAEALALAIGGLVSAGATLEGACRFLEMDEEDIRALVGALDTVTPEPDPVVDPTGGTGDGGDGGDGADALDGTPPAGASGNEATGSVGNPGTGAGGSNGGA